MSTWICLFLSLQYKVNSPTDPVTRTIADQYVSNRQFYSSDLSGVRFTVYASYIQTDN